MASRNRTISLSDAESRALSGRLQCLRAAASVAAVKNKILTQDMVEACRHLPKNFVDLLFLDPPYNLNKNFNGTVFKQQNIEDYKELLSQWMEALLPTLKPTASVYICGDWRSSVSIYEAASRFFKVHNRITWEREKGRGALRNWKNCSEDIWFCTLSSDYYFDADAVKLKRKVIAPYTDDHNNPKDWEESEDGRYRLTFPSNLWTDLTVPFWSMPENTEHPTQKPEKLLAKLLMASTQKGDVVLDPFLGSGTTAVVAKKLDRNYVGIELDPHYSCLALKRLDMAEKQRSIQGYKDGVFWERNSLSDQKKEAPITTIDSLARKSA